MKKIIVTSSYGKKRVRVQTVNTEPSKTDPSQAPATDINIIMKRYTLNQLPPVPEVYSDLTLMGDLHDAYEAIQYGEKAFNALPSDLRVKLNNDPRQLYDYLSDPSNDDEAIRLGLKNKKPSNDVVVEETKPSGAVGKNTKQQKTKTPEPTTDET